MKRCNQIETYLSFERESREQELEQRRLVVGGSLPQGLLLDFRGKKTVLCVCRGNSEQRYGFGVLWPLCDLRRQIRCVDVSAKAERSHRKELGKPWGALQERRKYWC